MTKANVSIALVSIALLLGWGQPVQRVCAQAPATDIWTAAVMGDLAAIKKHAAAGTNLNGKEPGGGSTPLIIAGLFGQTEAAALLIEKGAKIDLQNNDRNTALHLAAFFGNEATAKLLLSKGADHTLTNKEGNTPLKMIAPPWGPQLEGVYKYIGGLLKIQFDLAKIKAARPKIAQLLRAHAKKVSPTDSKPRLTAKTAPPITAADWVSYNNGPAGWRFNSAEKSLSPANASKLVEKWRFPAKGSSQTLGVIHATPIVVNGYAYFGTATYSAFYKLKPNGQVAWVYRPGTGKTTRSLPKGGLNRIDAGNGFLSSALVTKTAVFIGNNSGVFYALDRFTGKELWKVNTRAEGFPEHHWANLFNASAIFADGKVIVGGGGYEHAHPLDPNYPCCTGRGFVVAFEPATGKVAWKYEVGEKPKRFDKPVEITDPKGKHVYLYGPSTSSVWSTPSYDADTGSIFFGTDVHNSPRKPTKDNPRYDTKYSAAVIAVDVKTGKEKWVTQINKGDIYNLTMAGYDPNTGVYKDGSIGDTPKIYTTNINGNAIKVLGVGCKNGGFYLLDAGSGKIITNTPIYNGKPQMPLNPKPDPRMIALPSTIGGIQTGCATDGKRIFTNGIDWISSNTLKPNWPESGRVVSISMDLAKEYWRHERPKIRSRAYTGGDPIASGVALGGGIACFTTTITEQLVVLDAASGKVLKQFNIGTVWSGPSISRGRIYVGTGSVLFLKKEYKGTFYSFGLPGKDEVDRMGAGTE